jgi:hypothetical protein
MASQEGRGDFDGNFDADPREVTPSAVITSWVGSRLDPGGIVSYAFDRRFQLSYRAPPHRQRRQPQDGVEPWFA